MKALVYTGTEELVYRDEKNPSELKGESILKVHASGICGSDMHAYHGKDERRIPPLILGHEVSGQVQNGKFKGKDVRIFISKNVKDGNLGKWDDEKTLQKMIDEEDIEVISLQYEDDYWWLNLGFDKNGYIVTNDDLKDWQAKNPEKIGELHARKVSFMVSKLCFI